MGAALIGVVAGCAAGDRVGAPSAALEPGPRTLTLVLPAAKGRAQALRSIQSLPAPAQYQITLSAADLATPSVTTVTASASAQTLQVQNAPAGSNRVIQVQGEDASGNPLNGALWMAVTTISGATTQVVLDAETTAVGEVFARWLQQGQTQLAGTASPSVVATDLDAIMSANALPNYAFVNSSSWADTVAAAAGNMNVGTSFAILPGQADITLSGVPDDVPASLWVSDPASPMQTGLSPTTSQAQTFSISPILPGSWTVWASAPGLGLASASLTVAAGATASATVAFPGWQAGPSLPIPTGNSGVTTDGRYIYVVGGVLQGGTQTAGCWMLDSEAASPSWTALPALQSPREGAVAAVVNGILYMAGGTASGYDYDDAYSLDLNPLGTWQLVPGASAPDSHFQAHPDDPLAAIASGSDFLTLWTFFDDQSTPPYALSHFGVFDPGTDLWTYDPSSLPSMEVPRRRAGVAVFNGAVVVAGGDREEIAQGTITTGTALPDVASVEGLIDGRWSAWPDLPAGRAELSLAQAGTYLYAAGGVDSSETPVSDVYRFDPASASWGPAPPLTTPRSAFGLVYAGGKLWAIGGSPAHQLNESTYGSALALSSVETLAVP